MDGAEQAALGRGLVPAVLDSGSRTHVLGELIGEPRRDDGVRRDDIDHGLDRKKLARFGADPDKRLTFLRFVLSDEEDLSEKVWSGRSQPTVTRTTWG